MKSYGLLAGLALTASATANAAFLAPTDGNVNFFDICYGCDTSGIEIGIFDDSVTGDGSGADFLSVDLAGDVLTFDPTIYATDYGSATEFTVTNNAGDTLTLSESDVFQIALREGGGGWHSPSSLVCADSTDSCTTSWDGAMTALLVDVMEGRVPDEGGIDNGNGNGEVPPIPVPAAAWLLGSGLIGMVGVARRKRAA